MAMQAYLKLKGLKQGEIKGSVTQAGRKDKIGVVAVNHTIVSPRDPATGMPSGKRQHKPLTITKELDKSTPLLLQALVTNETISEWELQFITTAISAQTGVGAEKNHYTIKLVNATIASIDFIMDHTRKNADVAAGGLATQQQETERVSFTYQKIIWTWTDGGITAEDDWETPVT
ncbi:type VI secretion system tube protein TssD [Sorangium sp. So ce131]|uniref:type VI secretion system tube protein TssD n=1 Tax=Sorangium sp. So ce131 TaxID=3133282 RepID=UPI003F601202